MTPRGGLRTTPHAFHTCARFLPLPGYCVSRPGPGHARRTVRHRAASTGILSLHKASDISRVSTLCSRVTWLHGPGATQDGWRDQRATSRDKPHGRGRRGEASRAPVAEKERLRRLSSPLLPPYDRVPLPLITRCLTHDKTAGHAKRNLTTGGEVTHHKVFCRLRLRAERRPDLRLHLCRPHLRPRPVRSVEGTGLFLLGGGSGTPGSLSLEALCGPQSRPGHLTVEHPDLCPALHGEVAERTRRRTHTPTSSARRRPRWWHEVTRRRGHF